MRIIEVTALSCVLLNAAPALAQPTIIFESGSVPAPGSSMPGVLLHDQIDFCTNLGFDSQNFTDGGGVNDAFDNQSADDFVVPSFLQWVVERVEVSGFYGNGQPQFGPADSVNVFFYAGQAGLPGALEASALGVIPSAGLATGSFTIDLPTPVVLNPGSYWVSVQVNMAFVPNGEWFWITRPAQSFNGFAWKNPGNGFGTGCTSFTRATACEPLLTFPDLCFAIAGRVVPIAAPAPTLSNSAVMVAVGVFLAVGALSFLLRRRAFRLLSK